jgi:uncharacterized protein DUF6913
MGILNLKNKTAYKFIKNNTKITRNFDKNTVGKIKSVGVLAKADLFKTYDFTKKLIDEIGLKDHEIEVALLDELEPIKTIEIYNVYTDKSFGMYGKIKDKSLKKFVNTKFDLLINYCDSDNIFALVISFKSKAKMKAGFEYDHFNFNDISIKIAGNKIDTFNDELIKYLDILDLL